MIMRIAFRAVTLFDIIQKESPARYAEVDGFKVEEGGIEVQYPIFMTQRISKDEKEVKSFSR